MENSPNSPVFADRYRFEPVGNDWDRGRSGYTGPVYDLKENRPGVIKRTEIFPKQSPQKQSTHSLQNEVKALRILEGLGVPEVYDTGKVKYDLKEYDYVILEYVDGFRVEKYLYSLSIVERAEIITQLFGLLSQAHQKGIVNGDVDLKHLFWRQEKKQLIVIDWGNAKLGMDPNKKTEFAYDLARAAEIIFSLVTHQGHPLSTGSIALPDATALVKGLEILPVEFRELCKWAPRTPAEGVQAPYTAGELFEVSKKWLEAIRNSKPYKQNPPTQKKTWLLGVLFVGIIGFALLAVFVSRILPSLVVSATSTPAVFAESSVQPLNTNSLTIAPTLPTTIPVTPLTPTETPLPPLHSPLEYSSLVVFDTRVLDEIFGVKVLDLNSRLCWANEVSPPAELAKPEGFNRKVDETWWVFNTWDGRTIEESVKTDFSTCPQSGGGVSLIKSAKALALNTWVTQLEPENNDKPGGEFGLFLKDTNGFIREYMLWVDVNDDLHLRIRENTEVVYDDKVVIVNVQYSGRGNAYRQFRIQMFLEMDNNGSAIIYLLEAPSGSVEAKDIVPGQMIRVDAAARPMMTDIKSFGLIGRGGSTQVLIWPLALLGETNP